MMNTISRVNETLVIKRFLVELGNKNLKSLPVSVMKNLKTQSIYFETDNVEYVVSPFAVLFKTKGRVGREWYGYDNINPALLRLIRIAMSDKLYIDSASIEQDRIVFRYNDGTHSSIELIGAGIFQVTKPDMRVLMVRYDEKIDRFVSVSFIVEPIQVIEEVV
jgi:hypothetical protein